jgi:predicted dehydrogenase
MVEAGAIGAVRRVEFWTNRPWWPQGVDRPTELHAVPPTLDWNLWLGPAAERPYHPGYAPFKWRGWWDFGTGALGDMACHMMDAAYWTLQPRYPSRVTAEVSGIHPETGPEASRVEFEFPARGGRPAVTFVWRDGGLVPPRPADWPGEAMWPFDGNGQLWIGDRGTLVADTYGDGPRLSDPRMQAELEASPPAERYPRTDGVHAEWIAAIKAGTQPGSSFPGHAGPFTEMILLGNLAVRSGRSLEVDPETGVLRSGGIPDEWITPRYRSGWSL